MLSKNQGMRNRINSFTLTGNSSLHFELARDPTELIGAIFWQLKRIKIEQYDPILVNGAAAALQSDHSVLDPSTSPNGSTLASLGTPPKP